MKILRRTLTTLACIFVALALFFGIFVHTPMLWLPTQIATILDNVRDFAHFGLGLR